MSEVENAQSQSNWSEAENDILVADYFAMLGEELAGRPYVKAEHWRSIMAQIGRSKGSVERKYINVSHVLMQLGLPHIRGYKAYANAQFSALSAAIDRYLTAHQAEWDSPAMPLPSAPNTPNPFVPPPELSASAEEAGAIRHLMRKWDPAARDARNRALGRLGEEFVLEVERRRLHDADRRDHINQIRWVSNQDGDGAGYDILSFEPRSSQRRLIEVKATRGGPKVPFYLTRNEEATSREFPEEFRLYRVFDLPIDPKIFKLRAPLQESVRLEPATWIARF